jgi:beta-aspartyl-peptidase (threonine type)
MSSPVMVNEVKDWSVACHGGAGDISREVDTSQFYDPLTEITKKVHEFASSHLLDDSIQAIDVVEYAVTLFEDCESFNAGKGAVMTSESTFELEASIMDGATLACGAAVTLKRAKNPISVARVVMDHTEHHCLVGEEAEELAISTRQLEMVEPSYYYTERRHMQLLSSIETGTIVNDHDLEKPKPKQDPQNDNKFGTVGCVCWYKGHLAAATSTGGMTNKLPGRVGDTAIIGSGTYADDKTCAVSCTGKGEIFMRYVAAHSVAARMSLAGQTLRQATKEVIHDLLPSESGGLIAVDYKGNIVMDYNSRGMLRLQCDQSGSGVIGIWEEDVAVHV